MELYLFTHCTKCGGGHIAPMNNLLNVPGGEVPHGDPNDCKVHKQEMTEWHSRQNKRIEKMQKASTHN